MNTEKLQTLIALANEINVKTDRAAFLNLSGHVGWVSIYILREKTANSRSIYTNDFISSDADLDDAIDDLKRFLGVTA